MTFQPSYFLVSISSLSGSAPSDGFIDYKSSKDYVVVNGTDSEAGWATDLTHALAKARAYVRWQVIQQQLAIEVNPLSIVDMSAPGADANTPPSSFSFVVVYDRPDFLTTQDETTPGTTLNGSVAIQRYVARALIATVTKNTVVLDPTAVSGPTAHYGESNLLLTVGPLAANIGAATTAITVTQVTNT